MEDNFDKMLKEFLIERRLYKFIEQLKTYSGWEDINNKQYELCSSLHRNDTTIVVKNGERKLGITTILSIFSLFEFSNNKNIIFHSIENISHYCLKKYINFYDAHTFKTVGNVLYNGDSYLHFLPPNASSIQLHLKDVHHHGDTYFILEHDYRFGTEIFHISYIRFKKKYLYSRQHI